MRFNPVRNVKEAFQEENSLVQNFSLHRERKRIKEELLEGKIKYLTFLFLNLPKENYIFKTIIATMYCVFITQAM